VDDGSVDDTALKVHRFIKHRKSTLAVERKKVEQDLYAGRSGNPL
jgi:hypothetical protein